MGGRRWGWFKSIWCVFVCDISRESVRLDMCLERVRSSGRVLIGGVGDGKLLAGFQWVGREGVGFPCARCVGATSVVLSRSAGIGPLEFWRNLGGSLYFVGV